MSASKQDFIALDSVVGTTVGGAWDAFVQKNVGQNLNRLVDDLHQPALSRGYEAADTYTSKLTPSGVHSVIVNAPRGAWSMLDAPAMVYIPPGVTELRGMIQLEMESGETAYAFLATESQRWTRDLKQTDSRVLSCAGNGSSKTYGQAGAWTAPVVGRSSPQMLAVVVSSSGFRVDQHDRFNGTIPGEIFLSTTDTSPGTFATFDQDYCRRHDVWYRPFALRDTSLPGGLKTVMYEDSGTGYTNLPSFANAGVDEAMYPGTVADNDALYFGANRPFDGLEIEIGVQGNWSGGGPSLVWEYTDGASTWDTLTMWTDASASTPEIVDWTEAIGKYRVWWDMPDDWTLASHNSTTHYWVRARWATAPTTHTTTPQMSKASVLTSSEDGISPVWQRAYGAVTANGTTDDGLVVSSIGVQPQVTSTIVYVVGRATPFAVHALHIRPSPQL